MNIINNITKLNYSNSKSSKFDFEYSYVFNEYKQTNKRYENIDER